MDLLKRLEEDQEDLNELMKKHKALIAQVCTCFTVCLFGSLNCMFILNSNLSHCLSLLQSSNDISQIRELQVELEEVKKQKHSLQEEVPLLDNHKVDSALGDLWTKCAVETG